MINNEGIELFAWGVGVEYYTSKNPQVLLDFDSEITSSYKHNPLYMTVLQNAFAIGANNLPFSEVKKG
jgi:hypothetical protein